MISTALLIASLVGPADSAQLAAAHLDPRTSPGRVIVHRQPAVPLAAIRLSIIADDPPGYAGAGHLIQHMQLATLRERVARVGGNARIARNPDAFVYTVVGPASELEALAAALQAAIAPPQMSTAAFHVANRDLTRERLAEWETAEGHLRSQLRLQLIPEDRPAPGTGASGARLTPETAAAAWAEIYAPHNVSIAAAGDVRIAAVERAFAQLPPAVRGEPLPREAESPAPLARPEATRAWIGTGYGASDLSPPVVTVVAQLLTERLGDRLEVGEGQVEHWWTARGQALALIASVPGGTEDGARRALDGALASLQEAVREDDVRNAAHRVRREMLFRSRTPEGMVEMIGAFADRTGEANASQVFYDELLEVSFGDVHHAFARLLERTPARVEIPPQDLTRSR